ncbi:MAG: winged helix-turn-helix domain-containing protein [Pseudoxanthomonas sp.]
MPDTPLRHRRFGDYRLDAQARELRAMDGSVVPLNAKAFDALTCLIDNRQRVVGKDELLAVVWPGRVVEENNLTQAISALRRALGNEHRYIVTIPGRGYRFVADVEDGDAVPATPAIPATNPPPVGRRKTIMVGASLFVLALLAIAAWRLRAPPVTPVTPAAQSPQTLAVLPFHSLSPGPRDELLELGLAETLIARISGATSLRVRSLTSSQRFSGPKEDPLEAGRQLGAAYVVEGTTQRDGDRIRVNARLLAVRDGSALWSGTFDERIERAFTLQDSLAAAVASALELKIAALPVRGRSPCDGANAEAYRAYLAGRYQLDRPSAARMRQALAAFQRVIDLDPTCARAYAGMAFAYRALAMTGDQDPRENFPLAQAAVKQALEIDPDLAEAYASQGFIRFWYDWDWKGAEASFKRAIELNPSLAEAHMAYAHLLSNTGRNEEAVLQARQAVALDPLSPLVNTLASSFVGIAGHAREARQMRERALELKPDFWIALLGRSMILVEQRDYAGAIADLRKAREICGDCSQVLAVLGQAYVLAGDRGGAEQVLRDMEGRDRAGYMPATSLAAVHNALGDTGGALDLLERAYRERDVRLAFLKVDKRWDNLRSQPRFQALEQRMHLVADRAPGGS